MEMKTKKKKKATALFFKDKPHRQMISEQYPFQARGRTVVVIRRRGGTTRQMNLFPKQKE
jgi:hypothetical protein